MIAAATVSFYINGAWETPRGRTMGTVTNPATGAVLAEVPYANACDVDTAVRTAHAAFLKWREVPVVDRVQVLYRYKALLDKHANELAAILDECAAVHKAVYEAFVAYPLEQRLQA